MTQDNLEKWVYRLVLESQLSHYAMNKEWDMELTQAILGLIESGMVVMKDGKVVKLEDFFITEEPVDQYQADPNIGD